ncbi:MAG TPA: GNAT family N-acetyltransferase [Trebonia sp.]|nr:GNAT family N-acetyltransferase [Trebonia sp.]
MTEIRPATDADTGEIVRVRRASWVAAYSGIIPAPIIERATAGGGRAVSPPPWRRMLVAVSAPPADAPPVSAPPLPGEPRPVIGYAGFGPERAILPPSPAPLTPAGLGGEVGELYALYVTPDWWSAGVGRSLMDAVLAALRADGYQRAVLWVLEANARARRFYGKAGFRPDGAANEMPGLGGVVEVRYARDL